MTSVFQWLVLITTITNMVMWSINFFVFYRWDAISKRELLAIYATIGATAFLVLITSFIFGAR